ncbi:MAG: VCBS repeat-containing protein [Planctomycetota bacterium]
MSLSPHRDSSRFNAEVRWRVRPRLHRTFLSIWMMSVSGLGCSPPSPADVDLSPVALKIQARPPSDAESIRAFCGSCHAVPNPNSFEKQRWHEEVELGFRIYRQSQRTDLTPPDFDATVEYFRDAAPKSIRLEPPDRVADQRFRSIGLNVTLDAPIEAISSMTRLSGRNEPASFLITDMSTGVVATLKASSNRVGNDGVPMAEATQLTRAAHVARAAPSDLNGDGRTDYVVADLGTASPQTEREGSVWWLDHPVGNDAMTQTGKSESPRGNQDIAMQRFPLRMGLSRVAEVQPIDYDGDGDQDVLVGDFGLHFEGGIHLGINAGIAAGVPKFQWQRLDARPGTIAMPICDLNQDGLDDYLSLVTQHYEMIEAHLNQGNGSFETHLIHRALDPAFGSSSMSLIDFDGDGDLDVLYTNGDTFDDSLAKPSHGIQWLENTGAFPFQPHRIGWMPGCYHAAGGDFDGDGDTDVVAVALLTDAESSRYPKGTFDGVAWFERTDAGFSRHSLVIDTCQAATCAVVDWNQDGRLDILVPPCDLTYNETTQFTLFLNQPTPP